MHNRMFTRKGGGPAEQRDGWDGWNGAAHEDPDFAEVPAPSWRVVALLLGYGAAVTAGIVLAT